jgi:hypothetical protein
MDNRNNSIPFEKISARDVTDTHRRGGCLVAAMTFGLAHELWAKMPLESGYGGQDADTPAQATSRLSSAPQAPLATQKEVTMQDFLTACIDKGLTTHAADKLVDVIGNNFAGAIKTLAGKTADWVAEQNAQAEPAPKQSKTTKSGSAKANPNDY